MQTIETRSLWCGVYMICRGWPLLGVELRDGVAYFRFDRGSQRDMHAYHAGRALVELSDANKAHTEITVALKQARGQEVW
jgi:hypothetical protein